MSWLHDHEKRVEPLHVDHSLSHFMLKILHNSSTRIREWTLRPSQAQILLIKKGDQQ